ncbi:hypothetical protein [Thioalkalivibrio sp. HK1]|nr:hypothetical protein [Thioalkalivibrio sp. HK1]
MKDIHRGMGAMVGGQVSVSGGAGYPVGVPSRIGDVRGLFGE